MPERSSLLQAVQIGVEATPGTAVAANKLFTSIGIEPGIEVDPQTFRPMGQKFPSVITPGREWVVAPISGVLSYSEIIYLFASLFKSTAGVQEGATTAYRWEFEPAPRSEDTVKTLTVEQGGVVRAHKFAYGLVTDLSLDLARNGVSIGGSMLGAKISDGITMTGSPAAVEEKPVLPNQVNLYMNDTSGTIGTTKRDRFLSGALAISGRFNPLWTMNTAENSFVSHVETEPGFQLTVTEEADLAGMGLLTTMRNAATKFIRLEILSPDLAGTAFPYKISFDMAGKVSGVAPFEDAEGVYAVRWTFTAVYDATWGHAFWPKVWNKQTTL